MFIELVLLATMKNDLNFTAKSDLCEKPPMAPYTVQLEPFFDWKGILTELSVQVRDLMLAQ